jgi:hypothetical protein
MLSDLPKRLLQCGHWWSRRLSCTVLQCFAMSPFPAKRLLQWGHLQSRHFSCTAPCLVICKL